MTDEEMADELRNKGWRVETPPDLLGAVVVFAILFGFLWGIPAVLLLFGLAH